MWLFCWYLAFADCLLVCCTFLVGCLIGYVFCLLVFSLLLISLFGRFVLILVRVLDFDVFVVTLYFVYCLCFMLICFGGWFVASCAVWFGIDVHLLILVVFGLWWFYLFTWMGCLFCVAFDVVCVFLFWCLRRLGFWDFVLFNKVCWCLGCWLLFRRCLFVLWIGGLLLIYIVVTA